MVRERSAKPSTGVQFSFRPHIPAFIKSVFVSGDIFVSIVSDQLLVFRSNLSLLKVER